MPVQTPTTPAEIDAFLEALPKDQIKARECKHATYTLHRGGQSSDMLVAKEMVHLVDGRVFPTVRCYKDRKRPFWLTKKEYQNHTDKKTRESLKKLMKFETLQCRLNQAICQARGWGNPSNGLRMLARDQYLYGTDVTPATLLKYGYHKRWPGTITRNRLGVMDYETDMEATWFKPILLSGVTDDYIDFTVLASWIADEPNFLERLEKEYTVIRDQWINNVYMHLTDGDTSKPMPEYLEQVKRMKLRPVVLDTPEGMTKHVIDSFHVQQPDFVTGWNILFDLNVMQETFERAGMDVAEVVSDPRCPPEFKHWYLREGPKEKVAASGRSLRLGPAERWHIMESASSWKFIDAMCVYWQIRKAKGKEPSYSLDYTQKKNLGVGKLKFETGDSAMESGTTLWHTEMQRKYKLQYSIYNIFDCIGVWVQDAKNRDLTTQITMLAGASEYGHFNSQPKVNSNDMFFSWLETDRSVMCSVSDQMETDLDRTLLDKDGWIVTIPSHNVVDNGLELFYDLPGIRSQYRRYVSDADIETTYPTGEIIMNVFKETTMFELSRIKGVTGEQQRLTGINLTGGPVNAIELMESVNKAPDLNTWLEAFEKEMAEQPQLQSA